MNYSKGSRSSSRRSSTGRNTYTNILRSVTPEKMFVNYPKSSGIPTGVSARSSAVCQRNGMKIEKLPSNIPEILNQGFFWNLPTVPDLKCLYAPVVNQIEHGVSSDLQNLLTFLQREYILYILHSRTNMTRKAKARQEFRRFQLAG